MYPYTYIHDHKDPVKSQAYLKAVFTFHRGRLLVDWSYTAVREVVRICKAQKLDGYGGRSLRDLETQMNYMGRIVFTREVYVENSVQGLKETLPGENADYPVVFGPPTVTLVLQSASGQRRLLARIHTHAEGHLVGTLTDGGFSTTFGTTHPWVWLSWETRGPEYANARDCGWEGRNLKGLTSWGKWLESEFKRGGFEAVWVAMEQIWSQIIASRPRTAPITQTNIQIRWRTHNRMPVRVFGRDFTEQGVLTDVKTSGDGDIWAVRIDSKWLEVSNIYELVPYPFAPH